jgi:hypothetical protein
MKRDEPIEDESYRDAVAAAARRGAGGGGGGGGVSGSAIFQPQHQVVPRAKTPGHLHEHCDGGVHALHSQPLLQQVCQRLHSLGQAISGA